jgi:hydrogenase maturation protease
LVIGLGNPILGDDGVGWRVAEQVQAVAPAGVEIDYLSLGGLSLMERLVGYRRVILIDAITTGRSQPGAVSIFALQDMPGNAASHLSSAHDTDLPTAIQVGRSMGAELPEQILVVAIEAEINYDFSESLSQPVAKAVPQAANLVLEKLRQWS